MNIFLKKYLKNVSCDSFKVFKKRNEVTIMSHFRQPLNPLKKKTIFALSKIFATKS